MSKLTLLLIPLIFLSSCTIDWNNEKDAKIAELEKQVTEISKKETSLKFEEISFNKIPSDTRLIKCTGKYDSSMAISESEGISEGSITSNSEDFEVTILEEKVTMFGAEFLILENSDEYLIAMRKYDTSGLTELLQLNKSNGILYDSKTYTRHIGNAPAGFDTIFTCKSPL